MQLVNINKINGYNRNISYKIVYKMNVYAKKQKEIERTQRFKDDLCTIKSYEFKLINLVPVQKLSECFWLNEILI